MSSKYFQTKYLCKHRNWVSNFIYIDEHMYESAFLPKTSICVKYQTHTHTNLCGH